MALFSEREGLKPKRVNIQIDEVDTELRTALWNVTTLQCWAPAAEDTMGQLLGLNDTVVRRVVSDWLKIPTEASPYRWEGVEDDVRERFFSCEWGYVYDLLELLAEHYPFSYEDDRKRFVRECNRVMQRELSAYRFIGDKIVRVTSEHEIDAIERALESAPDPVAEQLSTALRLLSNRKSPDYRNSIKESISAVEAVCRSAAGNPKASLGRVVTELGLHPALEKALRSLYGWTSDAEGIRHALMDKPLVDFEDAKFMLVVCSAFVSYVTAKYPRRGER